MSISYRNCILALCCNMFYLPKWINKFTVLPSRPDRRICEACPSISDIVNIHGECEPCAEGSFPNGERTACFSCQADEIILYDGSCKRCQDGSIPNEIHRFCVSCPKSLIAKGGICESCPDPNKEWFIKIEAETWTCYQKQIPALFHKCGAIDGSD